MCNRNCIWSVKYIYNSELAWMHLHCNFNCISNAMRFKKIVWILKILKMNQKIIHNMKLKPPVGGGKSFLISELFIQYSWFVQKMTIFMNRSLNQSLKPVHFFLTSIRETIILTITIDTVSRLKIHTIKNLQLQRIKACFSHCLPIS